MPVSNGECPTDLLGLNINCTENGVFMNMVNKDKWKYDATFTVRVDRATKDRLWEAAKARDITPSKYVRELVTLGKLPNDLCELLPPNYRERVEEHARRQKKEPGEVVLGLIRMGLPYALDNMGLGI